MGKEGRNIHPTGIEALDAELSGGIPAGSTILVSGSSGLGKTILCLQWMFLGLKNFNEPALYLAATESIEKVLESAEAFDFYDASAVSVDKVNFVDFRELIRSLNLGLMELDPGSRIDQEEITRTLLAVRKLIEQSGAKRLVIDSLTAICYRLHSPDVIRMFIFRLGTMLNELDCTAFLISEVPPDAKNYSNFGVEEFICDGVISLDFVDRYDSMLRSLRIVKMRGMESSNELMYYDINQEGVKIYQPPQIAFSESYSEERAGTGIDLLDQMFNGGVFRETTTLISGSSGTGKSILGISFINNGLSQGEKTLIISYEESKTQIFRTGKEFGSDFEAHEKDGNLRILNLFPERLSIELQLDMVKEQIEQFKPKRILVDSFAGLRNSFDSAVFHEYARSLHYYLKLNKITSFFIDTISQTENNAAIASNGISAFVDNIILLRYVELDSTIRRAINVLKTRGSDHDKLLREYLISDKGLEITNPLKGVRGILSGSGHLANNPEE